MQLLSKFFASKVHKTSERERRLLAASQSQSGPRPDSEQHQRPAELGGGGGEGGEGGEGGQERGEAATEVLGEQGEGGSLF